MNSYKNIQGPAMHWLKGNLGQFDRIKAHQFFYDTARKYGGRARIRLLHKEFIIFQDHETVQTILKNRPEKFRRTRLMESIFKEMDAHGVFTAENSDWKKQRILMNPAFKPSQIKVFYPQIANITQRLCNRIAQEPSHIDIQSVLMSYTVDVTSSLVFGTDVNTLENPNDQLQENLNVIFPMMSYRLRSPFPYWRWIKLKRDRALIKSLEQVRTQVDFFIRSAREKINARAATRVDEAENLLEALILTKDEHGQGFSEQEIAGNVLTLLLAGEDTTANTLAWAIDFLAENPLLQDALHQEITERYPSEGTPTVEQLTEFELVSGVIHETLRLKPVAPFLYIEPLHNEIVEGYEIPAGTKMILLLGGDGFDETLFPQPQLFDPYRWVTLPEDIRKDYATRLMPFGYGSRLCPGRQLSFVEMRLSLIELIRRFRFKRTPGSQPADEALNFTLQPTGLRVDCVARESFARH